MDALTASPLIPAPLELQLEGMRFAAPEFLVTATARRRRTDGTEPRFL